MSHYSPFESPRLKIKQARNHAKSAADIHKVFVDNVKVYFVPIPSGHPDFSTYVCRFDQSPPAELTSYALDCVHNLRACFDQAICDIARIRGKSTSGVRFPFAASDEELRKFLSSNRGRPIRSLGEDVVKIIEMCSPYQTKEMEWLKSLHDLDVLDKHNFSFAAFTIVAAHHRDMLAMPTIVQEMSIKHLGFNIAALPFKFNVGSTITIPAKNNILEDLVPRPDGIYATVPDGLPFANAPLLQLLKGLTNYSESLLNFLIYQLGDGTGIKHGPTPEL